MPGELRIHLVRFDIGVKLLYQCGNFGIIDFDAGIEQHPGDMFEQQHRRMEWWLVMLNGQQRPPQLFQTGKILYRAILDPGILHEADKEHLRRAELLGRQGFMGVDHVSALVHDHGAIEFVPRHAADTIDGVGHMHDPPFEIGFEAVVIRRRRPQEEIAPPQCPQIEIELALIVDEERAAALLLQHRLGIFGLKRKVFGLTGKIAGIGLGTIERPALEAAQGQLRQQLIHDTQHGPQATRRLGRQLVDQLQIATHQFRIAETAGHGGQAGKQQGDHFARSHGGELHRRADAVADNIVAALLGHRRHLLQEGGDQVGATAEIGQPLGPFHIVVKTIGRHVTGGFVEDRFQRLFQLRCHGLQSFTIIVEFYTHHLPPTDRGAVLAKGPKHHPLLTEPTRFIQRRWRRRRRAFRAYRDHRSTAAPGQHDRPPQARRPWR